MPEANVQLTVEIETTGAEKLTTLRRDLEAAGKSGQEAFAGLDRAVRDAFDQQRNLADSIEPLFRNSFGRILTDARGFGDAFKRLFADLRNFVAGTIARMVADWLGGFRRLSGSATGGPLITSGSSTSLSSLTALLPGRSLTSAGGKGFGGFTGSGSGRTPFGGVFGSGRNAQVAGGLAFQGGMMLGMHGVRSGNLGSSIAGGALAGFSVGGPIGLVAGAGIGLVGGLLGASAARRRNRRGAARTEREFNAQVNSIFTEFQMGRLDFNQAKSSIDNARINFFNTVTGFGRAGRNALGRGDDRFTSMIEDLRRLDATRASRRSLLGSGPVPEFHTGGIVGRSGLASVDKGEAFLTQAATRAVGTETINRLNRNPNSGLGGTQIIFQPGSVVMQNGDPDEFIRQVGPKLKLYLDRQSRDAGVN